jgi:hypothetical protein
MKGMGTREKSIFNVFKNIDPDTGKSYGEFTEKDFFAIYLAFGLQNGQDLIEWLFSDLNSDELSTLSNILSKCKWSEGYNIPEILNNSKDNYTESKPKWSL